MKHLVLLGGGHSHLFVLEALAQAARKADFDPARRPAVTLVSGCRWHYYSGMLPGWIAGHYTLEQCRIDLPRLCDHAGVRFVEGYASSLDARSRTVLTGRETLHYDLLSLDIGSETHPGDLQAIGDRLLPIKPLHQFVQRWQAAATGTGQWAVVGGGAGGVELALAMQYAGQGAVTLISGDSGVLSGHGARLRRRVERILHTAGVTVVDADASVHNARLQAGAQTITADLVLAVTGPAAPRWLQGCGLMLDEAGFVLVDACHRSSDPRVFAAGDVCSRPHTQMARSGVHAVRAGPVLAANLLTALQLSELSEHQMQAYWPRRRVLYLLSCGRRYAVASWGNLSVQGRWIWFWKDWIDRRFIRRFTLDDKRLSLSPDGGKS